LHHFWANDAIKSDYEQGEVGRGEAQFFVFAALFIDSPAIKVYIRKYVVFGRAR
jgi:hypothetical protein